MRANIFALGSLGLAILASSCSAAVPSKQAPKPVAQQATPSASVAAIAPKPTPFIGKFRLDRAPEQGSLIRGWAPANTRSLPMDGRALEIAADGRLAFGVGRDAKGSVAIVAVTTDGQRIAETLPIAPRAWKIENLSTLPKQSLPDPEFNRRRPGELAQINAARRRINFAQGWRQKFIWPAKGRISGLFGSQRIYRGEPGSYHSGVDVAGPTGAGVVAPADGVVILAAASPFTLEGNLLMIDHGNGVNSAFLHLSRIDVKQGDAVVQGQRVGAIGATGRATGPHLHWGMKWQDERIDPQRFTGPM